ncbi:nucleotide exchange factor GrpE [Deinococcus alpinitundrae]|uniref:nucleotide exchange factor GrpE n=1 Tax=Deinococcus alpinitundrae TaxID=468913 RepID=UPI00137983CD|nr:nucleotide exchange factor GrpE [Deinococcus alpinitundrae]
MTNDNPNPDNLKFEPGTDQNGHAQTVEKVSEGEVIDAELLDENAELEDEDGGFPGMDGMDEGMFAQVQEMMAKMEKADELEKENADLKGRLGRLAADFESYRRRTQEDVSAAEGNGKAKAAEAMMPIYDALDRAVTMGAEDPAKLIPGMQAVQTSLLKIFSGLGLEASGKVGEHFDPQWHEALQVVPGDTDDTITQVYELGFKMGERLVRPARVVVSKKG